jgi:murein DD-endopeptidase MepM/ murein hydrolase activator NlpD
MTPKFSTIALVLATVPLASAGAAAQPLLRTMLRQPVHAACISSPFGPRVVPNQPEAGTYHYGVDLPAAMGTGVYATAAGTVIRVHQNGPGGLELLIQHDGFVGIYSHFELIMPDIAVPGRRVATGEQLGFVGNTGVSTGPHLYFEMILGGRPVDPAPYLRLALCDGAVPPAHPAAPDDGGAMIDGHKYWQFGIAARQYIQWQQH